MMLKIYLLLILCVILLLAVLLPSQQVSGDAMKAVIICSLCALIGIVWLNRRNSHV